MKRKIVLSESQIINAVRKVINEARRNPETNIDESFADFYNRMIQKAPRENIFVSFREETHVTDVNPVNKYRTPTGYYSYPLSSFDIDENPSEVEFRRSFPFANHREYINFFILKNHDGILTSKTDKSILNGYVRRIKKLYPNSSKVKELCDSFIDGSYSSDYNKTPVHDTHLFWLFLYDITKDKERGNRQNRINLICRKIGVNGIVDYGDGFIHPAEPSQAVFFRVKSLGEVFIYENPKISSYAVKHAIQNNEYEIVQALTDGINLIKVFDKYNLINKNGKILSKQWFERVHYFDHGFSKVELKDKYNFINKKGELLFSDKWLDDAMDFNGDFAAIKLNDKGWNLINQKGEILFPNQWFDSVISFGENTAHVILQDKSYQLNISTGDMQKRQRRERKSSYNKYKAGINKKKFNELE